MAALLDATHICQNFALAGGKGVEILHDINLSVREHEVIALVGPSGCGKSTLLRIMIGLQKPSSGELRYRGQLINGVNPAAALVFQNFALFPWLTVEENIALSLANRPMDGREQTALVRNSIDHVGLGGFENAYPRELSGGMKQRVGIARALVVKPEILCLDEPFSALDVLTAETLRNEVIDLYRTKDSPVNSILMVTHSVDEAVFMASRIIVLGRPPAGIRAVLDNPLPYPRDEYQPEFASLRQKLHALLSEALISDETAPCASPDQQAPIACAIPNVTLSATMGLLEILENEKGITNLTELGNRVDMPFTEMLLVVTAGELLGWVTTPGYQVRLTDGGQKVLAANVQTRKQLLNARLRQFRLFDLVLKMLEHAENHELDEELLLSQLAIAYPHEPSRQLFRTVVNWGRYAGLFQYNSSRKTLYWPATS